MISSWLKGLSNKYKMQVTFIHCDNAGENKKLEEKCIADGLDISLSIQQLLHLNKMHM